MAYYLTVKRQNKDILIDISMLDEFIKMSKYKNGGYSLEEIDNLTMSFENEYFFKDALYNKGLIELDDIKKEDKVYLLVAHNGISRAIESYVRDMSNEEFAGFGIKNCELRKYEF